MTKAVNFTQTTLREEACPWESKLGFLLVGKALVIQKGHATIIPRDFADLLIRSCVALLSEREEVRVRVASGELLGALSSAYGTQVYDETKSHVLGMIDQNLKREEENLVEDGEKMTVSKTGFSSPRKTADGIFHDTAGWRNLETSMNALEHMVVGCGSDFRPYLDEALVELILTALRHTNRFVRETGFNTLTSFLKTGILSSIDGPVLKEKRAELFAERIAAGLADNWSQVRLAASVACRELFQSIKEDEVKTEAFFPLLLPRLCLNRYYMAEGVKLYSQATWKMTVGAQGKTFVEKYCREVVDYYVTCTRADNHAVREAACHCIAELAIKLEQESLNPFVPRLLETLLECFEDDSWPVRDTACVASGNFVKAFPDASKDKIDTLLPLFLANLKDPISSVRQGAAIAISNALGAHPELLADVVEIIKDGLDGLKEQPKESHRYTDLSSGPATFGVAKKLRDNDVELHENQPMYSCGSLAPKMGRGGASSGGCSAAKFKKPSEPWEFADGAIHLLAEASILQENHGKIHPLLFKVANACGIRHYTMHFSLLETVLKRIPDLANNLGKRNFKPYLEEFMEPIFYAYEGDNALAKAASERCMMFLRDYLGPNIFRGRVEMANPRYLNILEELPLSSFKPQEQMSIHPPGSDFNLSGVAIPARGNNANTYSSLGGTPT